MSSIRGKEVTFCLDGILRARGRQDSLSAGAPTVAQMDTAYTTSSSWVEAARVFLHGSGIAITQYTSHALLFALFPLNERHVLEHNEEARRQHFLLLLQCRAAILDHMRLVLDACQLGCAMQLNLSYKHENTALDIFHPNMDAGAIVRLYKKHGFDGLTRLFFLGTSLPFDHLDARTRAVIAYFLYPQADRSRLSSSMENLTEYTFALRDRHANILRFIEKNILAHHR